MAAASATKVRNGGGACRQQGKLPCGGTGGGALILAKGGAQRGGSVGEGRRVKKHRRGEHGNRRFEFREPRGRIGKRAESHFAAVAEIGDRFRNQGECGIESRAVLGENAARPPRGGPARR